MEAEEFACFYDHHLSLIWLNGSGQPHFSGSWLQQWWTSDCPAEPKDQACSTSIIAAGGAGIRWRQTRDELTGYVTARPHGCYQVPLVEIESLLQPAAARR